MPILEFITDISSILCVHFGILYTNSTKPMPLAVLWDNFSFTDDIADLLSCSTMYTFYRTYLPFLYILRG